MQTIRQILINSLPLLRILAGAIAGGIILQYDTVPMDAVVAASTIPVFLGLFTEELEAR